MYGKNRLPSNKDLEDIDIIEALENVHGALFHILLGKYEANKEYDNFYIELKKYDKKLYEELFYTLPKDYWLKIKS